MNTLISNESAQEQVKAFLDYYDLDLDGIADEDQRKNVMGAVDRLVRHIQAGRVEIGMSGDSLAVTQHLQGGASLAYQELTGSIRLEADKGNGVIGRMYCTVGALTGVGLAGIKKLRGKDVSAAECLGVLFLLV